MFCKTGLCYNNTQHVFTDMFACISFIFFFLLTKIAKLHRSIKKIKKNAKMIVDSKVTNTKRRDGQKKENITPSSRAENAYMRLHTHVSAFLQENLLQ